MENTTQLNVGLLNQELTLTEFNFQTSHRVQAHKK